MKTKMLLIVLALWAFSLLGCASGVRYEMMADRIPTVQEEQGRIFFYCDRSPFGSAIHPIVWLNDQEVGRSVPGGFFYVDRPPGEYAVRCTTETNQTLTFILAAGDVRYVRTVMTPGAFVGRVQPILEDEEQAMKILTKAAYIGDKVQ